MATPFLALTALPCQGACSKENDVNRAPLQLWPPAFDVAIFDFDGTIAATGWIWEEVDRIFLGARGIPYTEEYARVLSTLGFAGGAEYTIETYGLHEKPEDICAEWTRLSHALYCTRVVLREGVEEYIKALRASGVRTALATANEPELISSIRKIDMDSLFDTLVHGRDVNATKEQPDIYLEAARRLGAKPTRCMVFEDIVPGICAARDASFMTCGVASGEPAQLEDVVRQEADIFIEDWTCIPL